MSADPRRVLLVDDEAPILQATRDLLREFDYEVETHADPATVLERVRALRPQVLLQDIRMPGLDLRTLVAQLRADEATRETRIVLFSASVEAIDLARELALPLVRKPFKPKALLEALEKA